MPRYDEKNESFIVRIWLEPRELRGAPAVWKGEIEHVLSRKRHFFTSLDKIAELIRPYLVNLGIEAKPSPNEEQAEE